jgi:hypothetical protein
VNLSLPPCEWPVNEDESRRCGAPSEWETHELGEYHHLCEPCCTAALLMNDFRAERIAA